MDLTVVTNSMPVVSELLQEENLNLFLLGGFLRRKLFDFYGPFLKEEIENLSINRAFLGVDGISGKFGLTTTDSSTADIEEAVIGSSREIIVAADSSKIGRVSLISYGKSVFSKMPSTLITDPGADEAELEAIRTMGFSVRVVDAKEETGGI
jgi:DeoR/GlpR family transcriptional regulator of sugar metabolism